MSRSTKTGRSSFLTLPLLRKFSGRLARCASAASLAAFLQYPAFLSSCSQEGLPLRQAVINLECTTKGQQPDAIDLFFFDTQGIQLLDSYQQLVLPQKNLYGLSTAGAKRLVALSGKAGERESWNRIRTYGNLSKHSFSLAKESVISPLLYGERLLPEGASRKAELALRPALAAVCLRSVSCDFSGRPYAGERFICTQSFLTFAGAEFLPLAEGGGKTVSWINPGCLDSLAVQALPEPEMIWRKGLGEIGKNRIYPRQSFYCYPGAETCLVLEGRIGNTRCYYPISLPQLKSDACLQLDVSLRRMGTPSPDIPAQNGTIVLEVNGLPWEEWNPYTEKF